MRRFLALLSVAALAALGAVALPSVAASAASPSTTITVPFHTHIDSIRGMVPPVSTQNHAVTNSAPHAGHLYYRGGPVMTTNTVYTIYWQPPGYQFPAGYATNINQYFRDLQATKGTNTNVYDVGTQYYQLTGSAKQYVQNNSTFAGTVLDKGTLPPQDPINCPDTPAAVISGGTNTPSTTASCVTDAQIQHEISQVVKQEGWKVSNHTEFFMFTAPNMGTCFPATVTATQGGFTTTVTVPLCSFSYFCAYHSNYFDSTINTSSQIIYSNMPYAAETAGNPLTCTTGQYPNGNPSDPEINVTSHEHNESITDPFGTSWTSNTGTEIGDMCAWDFGNQYGTSGKLYSQTINGHHYWMQSEYTDSTSGCPGSNATGAQVPTHPNYATPSITTTPNIGFPSAPFNIVGMFFAAGDHVSSTFTSAGSSNPQNLGSSSADASGRIFLRTRVPNSASAGTATVTSTGRSGTATTSFTVPSTTT